MSYFLEVDFGSVNAKLAFIDENGVVVQFDTEKVSSSPRAAVSSLIARLNKEFNLERLSTPVYLARTKVLFPKSWPGLEMPWQSITGNKL